MPPAAIQRPQADYGAKANEPFGVIRQRAECGECKWWTRAGESPGCRRANFRKRVGGEREQFTL